MGPAAVRFAAAAARRLTAPTGTEGGEDEGGEGEGGEAGGGEGGFGEAGGGSSLSSLQDAQDANATPTLTLTPTRTLT